MDAVHAARNLWASRVVDWSNERVPLDSTVHIDPVERLDTSV